MNKLHIIADKIRQIFSSSGWAFLAILSIIPVFMWMTMLPLSFRFADSYTFFTSIGQLTGLVGMVWYAVSFILNTRLRFLEPLFGGLNKVYTAHHIVGGIAFILVLIHPLALAARSATISLEQSALFLLPGANWANNFGIIALWLTVILLIATFYIKLPYEIWLFTHKILGLPLVFAGIHGLMISSDISRNSALRWYILGLTAIGIIAYVYRTLLAKFLIKKSIYVIDEVRTPTKDIVEIVASAKGKPIRPEAGQFVFIKFKDHLVNSEVHPFSLSSGPHDERIRITVKALGDYTAALPFLKVGGEVEVEGAYGKFAHNSFRNPNQLWIGGGIGITPFMSMARDLFKDEKKKQAANVTLIYSVRTKEDLIGNKELEQIAAAVPGLTVWPYIADEQNNEHLTATKIAEWLPDLGSRSVYICGPPGMMKALRKQMNVLGIDNNKIHTEEFSM